MTHGFVSAALRRLVVRRAANHCEYCGLSQRGQEAAFHVDHVVPVARGGESLLDNLALACVSCSLRKAAREAATDPRTGRVTPLFNPRHDVWRHHFLWKGDFIVGRTAIGRATVEALAMNRPIARAIRKEEALLGRHPWYGGGDQNRDTR